MSEKGLPSLLERHWAESALAIGAVVIAAASLWVAFDSERTNRELVASGSWPFVQVFETDAPFQGQAAMSLYMVNSGIGPAKLESFEVFWKGQPQRSPWQLLRSCCSQAQLPGGQWDNPSWLSATQGVVLRPGQSVNYFVYAQPTDAAAWKLLHDGRDNLSFRYCYCSVFNSCWLSTQHFGEDSGPDLNPPRVRVCPNPKVRFMNRRDR